MDVLETPDRRWRIETSTDGWKVFSRPDPSKPQTVLRFGPTRSLDAVVKYLTGQGIDVGTFRPV